MPNLTTVFNRSPEKALSRIETIQMLRNALIAEQDAIALYSLQATAVTNSVIKKLLTHLADEEKVHAGELLVAIDYLDSNEADQLTNGYNEFLNIVEIPRYMQ